MQPLDEPRLAFRRTVFIVATIFATIVAYAVLVEVLRAALKPFHGFSQIPLGRFQTVRLLGYGLAILAIVFLRLIRGRLLRVRAGEPAPAVLMRLMRTAILTSVLAEWPALCGLILFLLLGLTRDFYILLAVSLVVEFMFFPRRAAWDEILAQATPARSGGPR
jgi:hypothetical protein